MVEAIPIHEAPIATQAQRLCCLPRPHKATKAQRKKDLLRMWLSTTALCRI